VAVREDGEGLDVVQHTQENQSEPQNENVTEKEGIEKIGIVENLGWWLDSPDENNWEEESVLQSRDLTRVSNSCDVFLSVRESSHKQKELKDSKNDSLKKNSNN
jgi:hypothetical protein